MIINMKTTYKYLLAAVCAAPMILSGCQREIEFDAPANITARIADNDPQTRTSYDNLEGKFTWNEGDEIAIHFKGGKYETFAVSPNTDPVTGSVLSSSVGTKLRNDFAVYPATAAVVTADGAAPKVNFPTEYDLTALTGVDEEYAPAILLAANKPGEDLAFYHAGGLARFILTDVALTVTKIVVTFDKEVAGEFAAVTDDANEPIPYVMTRDGEGTSVTFIVNRTVIGTDKAIDLNLPVPCGTYEWVKVETYAGATLQNTLTHNSPMEFARHHGKRVAFVETEVELFIGNETGGTSLGNITVPARTPTLPNDGGQLTLAPAFVSYLVDGDRIEPVPFIIQYSTDGRNWLAPGDEGYPDWLSPAGTVDLNGSVPEYPQELTLAIDPLKNLIPMTAKGVPMPEGSRTANLQAKDPVAGVVDLSTINVATGATVLSSTANCYVIGAPGTYKFPAVYGNGLKGGEINEAAFHGMKKDPVSGEYVYRDDAPQAYYTSSSNAGFILGRFLDHKDELIMSPYIAEQLSTSNLTAQVLWMDQPGLIEQVHYEPGDAGATDDYIWFEITHDGIAQGNALIGLLDENNTIVWSWHIWVTDEDMTKTTNFNGFQMSPAIMGFCNRVQTEQYQRITGYVRIAQDYIGGKNSNSVRITIGTTGTTFLRGNSPYYQLGRKDPIVGMNGRESYYGDKKVYPARDENPFYPQFALLDMITYGESIQYPYKHYYPDTGQIRWLTKTYGNAWNSTQTSFVSTREYDPVTKTIYDPCPVGFKVPGPAVFPVQADLDRILAGKVAASSAPDGLLYYQFDETKLLSMGLREKFFRDFNSTIIRFALSDGLASSPRFIGTCWVIHESHRSVSVAGTYTYAMVVMPTVDE